jgi:hypothetical protein
MKKQILSIFLGFTFLSCFSQKEIKCLEYKVENSLFKNTLKSLLCIEDELSKNEKEFDYDIHYISINQKKEDFISITVERVKYEYILSDLIKSNSLGFFKIKGEIFVINGFIDKLFKKTKKTKYIKTPIVEDESLINIFDGALGEWKFILINGNFILEEGLLF